MFAYGMNTNPEEMARRCPGSRALGKARLPGYKFVFRGHADIEISERHEHVEGVLWEIDDLDLESLDILEGFPTYYLRQRVRVEHKGWDRVAWVYSMGDQSFSGGPTNSYFNLCEEGYVHFGVDTDQLYSALKYKTGEYSD